MKLSALMTIQRCVRGRQARQKLKTLKRLILIGEIDRELLELDLMREEDAMITYALFVNKSATDAQRTFRGFMARIRVFNKLVAKITGEQTEYYNQIAWVRWRYESHKKSLEAKAKLKIKRAIDIQRLVRGVNGRMKAEARRLFVFKESNVRQIQRAYRNHLARLILKALRRAFITEKKFRKVKKDRARVLRFFGVKSRAKDKLGGRKGLMKYIEYAGIDPISFNLFPRSLMDETIHDFRKLVQIFNRYVHVNKHD